MKKKHLADRLKFLERNEVDWSPAEQNANAIIVDVDIKK